MAPNNLNIAVVLRHFSQSGGLELYAYKVVEGLLADGHRISVICEKDESSMDHPNLSVHTFSPPPRKASKAERLDYYYEKASNAVEGLGPFDIVHSHHLPIKAADVVTFHNHTAARLSEVGYAWERILNNLKMALNPAYQMRHKYDGILSRTAKVRVFVGEVMKDDFYKQFDLQANAPYAVAHPGAGLAAHAAPTHAEQKAGEPFTFLFVGKGYRKKGLDTLIESCKILKGRGHAFALNIAGIRVSAAGQIRRALLGLPLNYLGFRRDMENVYAGCQAIVLPSKIEPFGMAPIQAMHYGLVPIVSRVCGVAEVLSDGANALILKNHLSPKELADLMEKLIVDRELYKALQSQAKETADRLNWRQTVEATEKAYALALEDKAKKPA